jgi:hypothetical protein
MTRSKYSYGVTQLESQGVFYPDAHMFVQDYFYQAEPDVVVAIMTQLSLKAGLKEGGKKRFKAAHSEIKQLHLRKTFKPKHWRELSRAQRQTVLESHMFLKLKRDGKIKGRQSLVEIKSGTKSPRKMLAHQPSQRNQCFFRVS